MPHRVWASILLGLGVAVFAMARQIATWKTRAWAKFYSQHPGAAERNPLSKHAGSDRSVRLGTFMWRVAHPCVLCKGGIPECDHYRILILILIFPSLRLGLRIE
jgi:hypothetical protein